LNVFKALNFIKIWFYQMVGSTTEAGYVGLPLR